MNKNDIENKFMRAVGEAQSKMEDGVWEALWEALREAVDEAYELGVDRERNRLLIAQADCFHTSMRPQRPGDRGYCEDGKYGEQMVCTECNRTVLKQFVPESILANAMRGKSYE